MYGISRECIAPLKETLGGMHQRGRGCLWGYLVIGSGRKKIDDILNPMPCLSQRQRALTGHFRAKTSRAQASKNSRKTKEQDGQIYLR